MSFVVQKKGHFDGPEEWRDSYTAATRQEAEDMAQAMRDYQDDDYDGRFLQWRVIETDNPCHTCGGSEECEDVLPFYGASNAYHTVTACPDCRD